MPYTYPPAPGVLTGNTYSASRFLNQPAFVQRVLRTIAQQRFIADVLLSGRVRASGGAVMYEVSEPIYADRKPEAVSPGGDYPMSGIPTGLPALAVTSKWGSGTEITDEQITRSNMDPVNRAMRKIINQMVATIDGLFLSAIGAAVTQTQPATSAWSTISTANILLDANLAKAKINGLNQGYSPDTLVIGDTLGAYLLSDRNIIAGLGREGNAPVTVSANVPVIGDLRILVSPNLPAGVNALVLDSNALGSVAYEQIESPGYAGDPSTTVETKVIRDDKRDRWLLQARRPVAPMIQEPNAACVITGA